MAYKQQQQQSEAPNPTLSDGRNQSAVMTPNVGGNSSSRSRTTNTRTPPAGPGLPLLPTPAPVQSQAAAPATPPTTTPKGLIPKEPAPLAPNIPAPQIVGPLDSPERYRKSGPNGWEINALSEGVGQKPAITPLRFQFGARPELKPLLRTDGVVVRVGEHYLVSPQTLSDIRDGGNPHYDIVQNGTVLNTPMGISVPVIVVDIAGLEATGSRRDIVNGFAAVKSVDYVYETSTVMGVPEGILEQINYTINPDTQRPEDRFEIWELNLTGDYSIEKLRTDTAQQDGRLDKDKLKRFTTEVGDRLTLLQKDLNIIKTIFYRGELPESGRKQSVKITKRATSDDTEEEILKPERANYTIRTTAVVGHSPTPNSSGVATTPTPTPPAEVAPTPVSTAGTLSAGVLNQWKAYGFTPRESADIKLMAADNRPRFVVIADGSTIGIGSVRFDPTTAGKARVVVPVGVKRVGDSRALYDTYYGTGLSVNELDRLNAGRVAELLALANKVVEIERSTGLTY